MSFETILPDSHRETYERMRFAPAVRVGDHVHVSGVIAALNEGEAPTPETYSAGFERAFAEISAILEEAGASMADVYDVTSYHVDGPSHLSSLIGPKDKWFKAPYPAWTLIGVAGLLNPLGFAEIKVAAYAPR